jgi:hypothetical protein
MLLRHFCLLILAAGTICCQELHLGVQGGVPFGDFFSPDLTGGLNEGFFYYNSKPVPYTVGPIANVELPHRFEIEAGVLYQRFHYTYWGQFINSFSPGVTNVWSKTTGNAWSFPLLLEWRPLRRYPFYIGAGPVIRNLRGLDQVVDYESTFSLGGPVMTKTARIETNNPPDLRKTWYPGVEVNAGWHFALSTLSSSCLTRDSLYSLDGQYRGRSTTLAVPRESNRSDARIYIRDIGALARQNPIIHSQYLRRTC